MAAWKHTSTISTRSGRRGVYESEDGRFKIVWEERLGARSGWLVKDNQGRLRSCRADTLAEAKEAGREMLLNEMTRIICSPDWGEK
jgi:hypothetical protein